MRRTVVKMTRNLSLEQLLESKKVDQKKPAARREKKTRLSNLPTSSRMNSETPTASMRKAT